MSETPHGISPDQVVRLFEPSLVDAEVSTGLAEHRLQAARDAAEEAQIKLAKAEFMYEYHRDNQASLRAAGRAALNAAEGYPVEATFRAQMQLQGQSEKAEEVLGHIAAINEYARTDNALMAYIRPGYSDDKIEVFVPLEEKAASLAWLDRDERSGDYFVVKSDEVYGENPNQPRLSRNAVEVPPTQVNFAATAQDVERMLSAEKITPTVIYNDEAVQTLVAAPELMRRARQRFKRDLGLFVGLVTVRGWDPSSADMTLAMPAPRTQKFLEIPDSELLEVVETTIAHWTSADARAVPLCYGKSVNSTWLDAALQLKRRGFKDLPMTDPAQKMHSLAMIEFAGLAGSLHTTPSTRPLARHNLKKALKAVEARLDDLEDVDGSGA